MSALQPAFHEKLGTQCGFCTPGMIMAAEALLRQNPAPTEAEIRAALAGNLCRCTGYVKIIESVQAVGTDPADRCGKRISVNAPDQRRLSPVSDTRPSAVGVRQPLIDGIEKVTGRARYTADLPAPGALVGAILRSPVAHGAIHDIDAEAARALPGVRAVITGDDCDMRVRRHSGRAERVPARARARPLPRRADRCRRGRRRSDRACGARH